MAEKWDSRLMASGRVMIYRDEWAMGSFSNPENAAEIVGRLCAAEALAVALEKLTAGKPWRYLSCCPNGPTEGCKLCGDYFEALAALAQWRAATVREYRMVQPGEKEGK